MDVSEITVSIAVRDLSVSRIWYKEFLDNPEEIEPVSGIIEFKVSNSWLQLYEGNTHSSGWVFRVGVKNLEMERKRINGNGIETNEIETVPGVISFFDLRDPDDNRLSVYQLLD